MNKRLQQAVIILSVLLPLLAVVLYWFAWQERELVTSLKEPEKYPLEFKVVKRSTTPKGLMSNVVYGGIPKLRVFPLFHP